MGGGVGGGGGVERQRGRKREIDRDGVIESRMDRDTEG